MFGVACKLNHTWRTIRHGPYMIRSSCTPLRSIPLLAQTRKGTFALFRPVLDSLHHGKTHTDHAPELGQHSAADDKPNCQGQRRRAWQPRINEKRPLKKELTERIVWPADGHGAPRHDTTRHALPHTVPPSRVASLKSSSASFSWLAAPVDRQARCRETINQTTWSAANQD